MALRTVLLTAAATLASGREITFPPVIPQAQQHPFGSINVDLTPGLSEDISTSRFGGLTTFANLPYVHCLAADEKDVESYDIAILGAPFDTVYSPIRTPLAESSKLTRW